MKKSIIISIQPQWVEKILNGKKTIEIRKSIPKCDLPIDVYIYCTKSDINLYKVIREVYMYFDMGVAEPFEDFKYYKLDDYDYSNKGKARFNIDDGFYDELYCKLNGKIVAKFTLNNIERFDVPYPAWFYEVKDKLQHITDGSCLTLLSLHHYLKNDSGFAWHIDNLEIFDKPMELSEFYINNFESKFDYMDCGFQECGNAIQNSILGDDGYCYPQNCPKMRVTKAPQSWCYCYKEKE